MSNHNKKLRRKQYNLEKNRDETTKLIERLNRQITKDTQIFDDCAQIKVEEPLDPKFFDKLMISRLEDLEQLKSDYQKLLQKKESLDKTPNFI